MFKYMYLPKRPGVREHVKEEHITVLPSDCLAFVLGFCDITTLGICRLVCRFFNECGTSRVAWYGRKIELSIKKIPEFREDHVKFIENVQPTELVVLNEYISNFLQINAFRVLTVSMSLDKLENFDFCALLLGLNKFTKLRNVTMEFTGFADVPKEYEMIPVNKTVRVLEIVDKRPRDYTNSENLYSYVTSGDVSACTCYYVILQKFSELQSVKFSDECVPLVQIRYDFVALLTKMKRLVSVDLGRSVLDLVTCFMYADENASEVPKFEILEEFEIKSLDYCSFVKFLEISPKLRKARIANIDFGGRKRERAYKHKILAKDGIVNTNLCVLSCRTLIEVKSEMDRLRLNEGSLTKHLRFGNPDFELEVKRSVVGYSFFKNTTSLKKLRCLMKYQALVTEIMKFEETLVELDLGQEKHFSLLNSKEEFNFKFFQEKFFQTAYLPLLRKLTLRFAFDHNHAEFISLALLYSMNLKNLENLKITTGGKDNTLFLRRTAPYYRTTSKNIVKRKRILVWEQACKLLGESVHEKLKFFSVEDICDYDFYKIVEIIPKHYPNVRNVEIFRVHELMDNKKCSRKLLGYNGQIRLVRSVFGAFMKNITEKRRTKFHLYLDVQLQTVENPLLDKLPEKRNVYTKSVVDLRPIGIPKDECFGGSWLELVIEAKCKNDKVFEENIPLWLQVDGMEVKIGEFQMVKKYVTAKKKKKEILTFGNLITLRRIENQNNNNNNGWGQDFNFDQYFEI